MNAIDININAPAFFPPLAGGPVSFHADFNAFSTAPIFASDALPTNTALGPESFDQSTVTLLPPAGVVSSSSLTSLTLTAVPEPSTAALVIVGLLVLVVARRATRPPARPRGSGQPSSHTARLLGPCAPITSACSMSAVLLGPQTKQPNGCAARSRRA